MTCFLIAKRYYMGVHMKYVMLLTLLSSLFTSVAFAKETTTECPMMREMNSRVNTKQNLANESKVPVHKKSSRARGE